MVVRPMRDYTAKEIAFYNRFFSVPTVTVPPLLTKVRGSRGGEPELWVPKVGTGPPSPALPSLLVPTAPGEAQHPLAGRALPAGAAGGVPLHHQYRVQVRGVPGGGNGGARGLGCTHTPRFGCRTGEKLSPEPAKASSEAQRCLLCLCGLDTEGGEWGGHRGARGIWGAAPSEPLSPGPCRGGAGSGAHADPGGASSRVSAWAGGDSRIPQPLPGHHSGTTERPCLCPCPHRAESKAAYIPLLCYSCRLTFKELVRFWGAGGGSGGDGGPQAQGPSRAGSPGHSATLRAC